MLSAPDQPILISSSALEGFDLAKTRGCRACGAEMGTWAKVLAWLRPRHSFTHAIGYCPGGKELTRPLGMVQAMMTGEAESVNPCAGIQEPHLHLRCNVCGFFFMMATKSPFVTMQLTATQAYLAALADIETAITEAEGIAGAGTSAYKPVFRLVLDTLFQQRVDRGELSPILPTPEDQPS